MVPVKRSSDHGVSPTFQDVIVTPAGPFVKVLLFTMMDASSEPLRSEMLICWRPANPGSTSKTLPMTSTFFTAQRRTG